MPFRRGSISSIDGAVQWPESMARCSVAHSRSVSRSDGPSGQTRRPDPTARRSGGINGANRRSSSESVGSSGTRRRAVGSRRGEKRTRPAVGSVSTELFVRTSRRAASGPTPLMPMPAGAGRVTRRCRLATGRAAAATDARPAARRWGGSRTTGEHRGRRRAEGSTFRAAKRRVRAARVRPGPNMSGPGSAGPDIFRAARRLSQGAAAAVAARAGRRCGTPPPLYVVACGARCAKRPLRDGPAHGPRGLGGWHAGSPWPRGRRLGGGPGPVSRAAGQAGRLAGDARGYPGGGGRADPITGQPPRDRAG